MMLDRTKTKSGGTLGRRLARELTGEELAEVSGSNDFTFFCSVPVTIEDCVEDVACY